ncbi:hypothetical protein OG417_44745 [Actinoallomurus sp. NBC_01490]|uniref:hypothetical protein n=1 Tax=Actinoallomurus sp. NBC_01490 TaxID=2903557 RepID=UPI002E33C9BF|nr:hypothetical protein [Actinoallomurus sp. NBC_01490]
MTNPGTEHPNLSDLPEAERSHPLFRKGYNLGYAHRALEDAPAELQQHRSQWAPAETATAPATFDVTSGGLLDRLAPGVRALRDLLNHTDKHITTETPCCGRRITLPAPNEQQERAAMCCRCHITYRVSLIWEEPDGYNDGQAPPVALFVVVDVDVAPAQHRTGKWESRDNRIKHATE